MAALLEKATAFIKSLPSRIAEARKAAAPVATAVLALLADPALGLDPKIAQSVAAVCAALGIVVYAVKNEPAA